MVNFDYAVLPFVSNSLRRNRLPLYCRRLGIDYTKPTGVEFEVMVGASKVQAFENLGQEATEMTVQDLCGKMYTLS